MLLCTCAVTDTGIIHIHRVSVTVQSNLIYNFIELNFHLLTDSKALDLYLISNLTVLDCCGAHERLFVSEVLGRLEALLEFLGQIDQVTDP